MLTAAACVQATNLVADRELVCDRIPDALCLRIVEVGFMQSRVDTAEREFGPLTKITVRGCQERGGAVQCWVVDVTTEEGAGSATKVIQLSNGSLVRAE